MVDFLYVIDSPHLSKIFCGPHDTIGWAAESRWWNTSWLEADTTPFKLLCIHANWRVLAVLIASMDLMTHWISLVKHRPPATRLCRDYRWAKQWTRSAASFCFDPLHTEASFCESVHWSEFREASGEWVVCIGATFTHWCVYDCCRVVQRSKTLPINTNGKYLQVNHYFLRPSCPCKDHFL